VVSCGIYRHVRHPIHGGWCLIVLGEALLTGSTFSIIVATATTAFYYAGAPKSAC
jgi:protein-S-isoprenylcysteine O-methyltransferase Ste14